MFQIEHRKDDTPPPYREEGAANPSADDRLVDPQLAKVAPTEESRRRHGVLMECLDDEKIGQSEERLQAAIDEDFYDHLQWRQEDAQVLIERGQAPLVFNESRQTIDWVAGSQKRMRTDYRILPREQGDEKAAELQSQGIKYTDDVNMTQWHRSRAFKQAALSGLSWLEEGVNTAPGEEVVHSGSEDWRNVFRDRRDRTFDLKDSRYLFRRKVTDLDYAAAMLPAWAHDHLRDRAGVDDEAIDTDDTWYLGERLTGASDIGHDVGLGRAWRDRSAFVSGAHGDRGRRSRVELLECWYRVPEAVQVFSHGPLARKMVDDKTPAHQQLLADGWGTFRAVRMRMRVMVATREKPLWDGPSPFKHDNFILVPVWGYRRYRDGACYGLMRGMRDLQEDSNKRASKAQWLLVNNRVVADKNAVEDIEQARDEANRADGWIEKREGAELRFEKPVAEIQLNLEMMDRNRSIMRNAGGVTDENLGYNSNARSGIAIERRQDQGSLTVSELFDNLLLAIKLAGKLRLSHMRQFWTDKKRLRIVGEATPIQWLELNSYDEASGQMHNDITEAECDYVVAEQNYRESFIRAATEEMFELLGKIATFAPQVVLAVLDLAVEGSEIQKKEEWVSRIRKLNGQRDPTKEPTPEEIAQAEAQAAAEAEAMEIQRQQALALLDKERNTATKLSVDAMAKRTETLMGLLQAAQALLAAPSSAPLADQLATEVGLVSQNTPSPTLPLPQAAAAPAMEPGAVAPPMAEAPPMIEGA
jgi:hypothetical protein